MPGLREKSADPRRMRASLQDQFAVNIPEPLMKSRSVGSDLSFFKDLA
jgi:hypothetical protein